MEFLLPITYFKIVVDGRFTDVARSENPEIYSAGMVTDAKWADVYGGPHKGVGYGWRMDGTAVFFLTMVG